MAAEQPVRIFEVVEPLVDVRCVAGVRDEAIRLQSSPAGPTNLSGFHQNEGQEVEQQAHRMHS